MPIYNHPLYHRWKDMNQACSCPTNPNFAWAGDRGIRVRFDDFWHFAEYVENTLGLPGPGQRLHRINQDGDYEPGNLMWSTSREIVNKTIRLKRSFILAEFCREHGLVYSTVRERLSRGQTLEQILQNPPKPKNEPQKI